VAPAGLAASPSTSFFLLFFFVAYVRSRRHPFILFSLSFFLSFLRLGALIFSQRASLQFSRYFVFKENLGDLPPSPICFHRVCTLNRTSSFFSSLFHCFGLGLPTQALMSPFG